MARKSRTNITPYWQVIERIVNEADIVLEVVDARLIRLSRNAQLSDLIKSSGRPNIVVVNKADLVSKQALEIEIEKVLRDERNVVYVSNRRANTVKNLLVQIRKVFKEYGKREKIEYAEKWKPREAKADIVVGVVGYPNVGKSALINALAFKKKAKVTARAGTTRGMHWIRATEDIKLIDTPGILPLEHGDEVRLGLIGARTSEKLKDPDLVAGKIIEMFIDYNKQAFERYYKIEIGDNPYEAIESLGRKRGHLRKGGEVDEIRTASMIVRDWQQGRLRL